MTNKQLKSDKKAIKLGLILLVGGLLFAGGVSAFDSFGQTDDFSVKSTEWTYGVGLTQTLNNKDSQIIGTIAGLKIWASNSSSWYSVCPVVGIGFHSYDIDTDEPVASGSWGGFAQLTIPANTNNPVLLDLAFDDEGQPLRNFGTPEPGTYRIWRINFWPGCGSYGGSYPGNLAIWGSESNFYSYGEISGTSMGNLKDIYFEFTGDFSAIPGGPGPGPGGPTILITAPENESIITDLEESFNFSYSGIDPEIFNFISFEWWNEAETMILAERTFYTDPENYWSIEESGEMSVPIGNLFTFEINGKYFLKIKGITLDFEMIEISVNPAGYWLSLNIEGLPDFFKMLAFDTWYIDHSKFSTPTPIFAEIVGFIGPVFDKIGNFGTQVKSFLNIDEAYTTGYSLGLIFPTFRHYVNEIEVFFSGFPIIKMFLGFMILLLGIFVFRLILKFIPGLGG